MPDAVIDTDGLRKQFGDVVAVSDLSLTIARGEVFGFLGPNGAGKTTSLKMLLGLITPSGGSGAVLGRPLGDRPTRARVGFLPEHFRFHDCLTGWELLRLHGNLFGRRGSSLEATIEALLARVDLLAAADQPVSEYSKGMLQRVGLAQALLNDPALVFLDEPTSGLDPLGRILVRDIIRDLRERGTTVFLNSHLLGEVEATCSRVAFVKNGRVVRELSLASAAELDIELRIGRVESTVLDGLSRFGDGVEQVDGVVRLRVRSEERLPALSRWLVERGVPLYGLSSRRRSLEALFLEVMGADQRPG